MPVNWIADCHLAASEVPGGQAAIASMLLLRSYYSRLLGWSPVLSQDMKQAFLFCSYLRGAVTRHPVTNAISSLEDNGGIMEYYCEWVFVVPLFLTMCAAVIKDLPQRELRVTEAMDQCLLYKKELEFPGSCLWEHHHAEGNEHDRDDCLWAMGNAMVANGMARVLVWVSKSTLQHLGSLSERVQVFRYTI